MLMMLGLCSLRSPFGSCGKGSPTFRGFGVPSTRRADADDARHVGALWSKAAELMIRAVWVCQVPAAERRW